jgi:hypothetical protein
VQLPEQHWAFDSQVALLNRQVQVPPLPVQTSEQQSAFTLQLPAAVTQHRPLSQSPPAQSLSLAQVCPEVPAVAAHFMTPPWSVQLPEQQSVP